MGKTKDNNEIALTGREWNELQNRVEVKCGRVNLEKSTKDNRDECLEWGTKYYENARDF